MDESTVLPRAVAACGVSFDGRAYHYQAYSYERLSDALAYAKLDQAKPAMREDVTPRRWRQWTPPTQEDRLQMEVYGIEYEHGYYCYGPYRYDFLSAALAYADTNQGSPGRAADKKGSGQ